MRSVINISALLFVVTAVLAQPAPPAPVAAPAFPAVTLPVGVAAFGEFNQIGNPRFTMGVAAIYPIVGSVGVYGTTTADITPKPGSIDPTTGKTFVAFSSSFRQGVHKSLLSTGRFTFLLGGDVGPNFSQLPAAGVSVNFSSSIVATAIYQVSPVFSLIVPTRMLYIGGVGWNPIAEGGILINLSNLAGAKK